MKRWFILLLIAVFCVSPAAMAKSGPAVIVESDAQDVPAFVIDDLRLAYPDTNLIRVIAWSDACGEQNQSFTLPHHWDYIQITTAITATDVSLSDDFVTSVAKGARMPLSPAFSKTRSSWVELTAGPGNSGVPTAAELGVFGSVTAKTNESDVFTGPPESSAANSRLYYVRFYGNTGTWSCTAVWTINPTARPKLSGTWEKPTCWVHYSIDETIQ